MTGLSPCGRTTRRPGTIAATPSRASNAGKRPWSAATAPSPHAPTTPMPGTTAASSSSASTGTRRPSFSCDRALTLRPDFAAALNNRGITLQSLNRPAEALASFDRALVAEARRCGHAEQSRQRPRTPGAAGGSAGLLRPGTGPQTRLRRSPPQPGQCPAAASQTPGGPGQLRIRAGAPARLPLPAGHLSLHPHAHVRLGRS